MRKIVDDLTAKLAKAGISVIETEESYTSKSSFIDNDLLPVYDKQKPRKHAFFWSSERLAENMYHKAVCISTQT